MDRRLKTLFDLAGEGETFLDIGCDHGLVSLKALKSGKFKRVIITDISAKSLQKAINLLSSYKGSVKAVVTDGFNGILDDVSVAFIAGMGGEEITKILLDAKKLPPKLVLSPQGHGEKVRKTLISLGYKLVNDFTLFSSGKYYDAISAIKGEDYYTNLQLKYGRENLLKKPTDFVNKLNKELQFKTSLLERNLSDEDKQLIINEISEIKEILNENN